jgi:hypothetical protein
LKESDRITIGEDSRGDPRKSSIVDECGIVEIDRRKFVLSSPVILAMLPFRFVARRRKIAVKVAASPLSVLTASMVRRFVLLDQLAEEILCR